MFSPRSGKNSNVHLNMDNFPKHLSDALSTMYDRLVEKKGLFVPLGIARGHKLLKDLNYPEELLARLPNGYAELAFPCANPLKRICSLQPRRLLDLGCGCALDTLFCALSLTELDELTAIDNSPALLARAEKLLGCFPELKTNLTLQRADLNQLNKTAFAKFDLILMNGSFNLIYRKLEFLSTLSGLLEEGGTLLIYDFLLTECLPPGFTQEIDNWLWNIGGALSRKELKQTLASVALKLLTVNELERIDPVARCELLIVHA